MLHIKGTTVLDALEAIKARAGFVILGFFRKALEISGAKKVDVRFSVPIEAGEKFCELALTWN